MVVTRHFVIIIAEAPKSLNAGGAGSRQHWSRAAEEKKRWEERYRMEFLERRIPKGMIFCKADVTIRWKNRNRRDEENFRPAIAKPLGDTLAPPRSRFQTIGGKRIALDNSLEHRWLPDDTAEYFKLGDVRFEYPDEWPYADPRVKAEMMLYLECEYPNG